MDHPLLVKAAGLVHQARGIMDEYTGQEEIPADRMEEVNRLLAEAKTLRERVEAEHAARREIKGLEAWLSEPQYKSPRAAGGEPVQEPGVVDTKALQAQAFYKYLARGMDTLTVEEKAALVEDASGQVLVPEDFQGVIFRELPRLAVIRNLATVVPTSRDSIRLASLGMVSFKWQKLETTIGQERQDSTPEPDDQVIQVHDLTGIAKLGEDLLMDAGTDLEARLSDLFAREAAEAEDDAFANGTGDANGQPQGILGDTRITQTVTAANLGTITADDLKKLQYAVPAQFRRNGVYVASSAVEQEVALLKDLEGRYLWQPSMAADRPAMFAGKPWYTQDGLPGFGDGTTPARTMFFGDVRQGYVILDRMRMSVKRLNELYAEDGLIGFRVVHRVGGAVIRPKAFAVLMT